MQHLARLISTVYSRSGFHNQEGGGGKSDDHLSISLEGKANAQLWNRLKAVNKRQLFRLSPGDRAGNPSSPRDVDVSSAEQHRQQKNQDKDGKRDVPSIQSGTCRGLCNWETADAQRGFLAPSEENELRQKYQRPANATGEAPSTEECWMSKHVQWEWRMQAEQTQRDGNILFSGFVVFFFFNPARASTHTEDSPSKAWLPKHSGLAARHHSVSQYVRTFTHFLWSFNKAAVN